MMSRFGNIFIPDASKWLKPLKKQAFARSKVPKKRSKKS
jgi:hypothetical protein